MDQQQQRLAAALRRRWPNRAAAFEALGLDANEFIDKEDSMNLPPNSAVPNTQRTEAQDQPTTQHLILAWLQANCAPEILKRLLFDLGIDEAALPAKPRNGNGPQNGAGAPPRTAPGIGMPPPRGPDPAMDAAVYDVEVAFPELALIGHDFDGPGTLGRRKAWRQAAASQRARGGGMATDRQIGNVPSLEECFPMWRPSRAP